MGTDDIIEHLRAYERELLGVIADVEHDLQSQASIGGAARARLQLFGERLNRDLLRAWDRLQSGVASADEREFLLPAIEALRSLVRSAAGSREPQVTVSRLKSAASIAARR